MAIERLEIGRLIVRGSLLPTPIEDTNPFERQGPHGGLMGFPLVALLLVIDPVPRRNAGSIQPPTPQTFVGGIRALEAPVDPGFFAAPLGHWCDPGIFLEFCGGGIACALFAKGDEEAGGEDRSGTWKGLEEGESRDGAGRAGRWRCQSPR